MPNNIVKHDSREYSKLSLKKTEDKWSKAKRAAKKQGHKEDWPYVNSIYQKMTQKYKRPGPLKKKTNESVQNGFNAYSSNISQTRSRVLSSGKSVGPDPFTKKQTYNQKFKIKKAMEAIMDPRNELRQFINEHAEELDELTVSQNLAIPTNIGGANSDEDIPPDVHDHEIDDTDDTEEDERTGNLGIKAGSGSNDPNA